MVQGTRLVTLDIPETKSSRHRFYVLGLSHRAPVHRCPQHTVTLRRVGFTFFVEPLASHAMCIVSSSEDFALDGWARFVEHLKLVDLGDSASPTRYMIMWEMARGILGFQDLLIM